MGVQCVFSKKAELPENGRSTLLGANTSIFGLLCLQLLASELHVRCYLFEFSAYRSFYDITINGAVGVGSVSCLYKLNVL